MVELLKPRLDIPLTISNSPDEIAGNPAAIFSVPISSKNDAIFIFSSNVRKTPGVCSPSLKVSSHMDTFLGRSVGSAPFSLLKSYNSSRNYSLVNLYCAFLDFSID